jgi:hypothetical protein
MNYVDPKLQPRRTQIVELLEMVCESLELSTSQFAQTKQRYEGVGACLAGSDDPVLRAITIYLQGSTALGPPSDRSASTNMTLTWWPTCPTWTSRCRRRR